MSHTPGPWEWIGDSMLWGKYGSHDRTVIEVGDDGKSYGMHSAVLVRNCDESVAEANARLIAAAPDLLESLRALEVLFAPLARDSTAADWVDKARAAIAKAEGR